MRDGVRPGALQRPEPAAYTKSFKLIKELGFKKSV